MGGRLEPGFVSRNRKLHVREPGDLQNEKTRQKAGFSGDPEILKAFSGTLYGAGTRSRTRDLLITSQLLYQLSYTGVWATIIAIGCVL